MPIVFAQPDPLDLSVSAGAAGAEFAAKTFPTIASIYENAARLRAQGGGGRGGGGGGGANNQIQVLPSGDGGVGLQQVEQQANREQRAADLGFDAQIDPVAKHIQMNEQFKIQQGQQQQQRQDQLLRQYNQGQNGQDNGQSQPPQPPPLTWSQADTVSLNSSVQAQADLQAEYEGGNIGLDVYKALNAPALQNFQALTQKQQAFQQQQQQQQFQAQQQTDVHQAALKVASAGAISSQSPRPPSGVQDVPGMMPVPRDFPVVNSKGDVVNLNEKKQIAVMNENAKAKLAAQTAQHQREETERKTRADEEKEYNGHLGTAIKRVDKLEDEFMKGNGTTVDGKVQNRYRPDSETRASQVGDELESLGLPRSLDEFHEKRDMAKNTIPQVRAAFVGHLSSLPQTEDGTPDWNHATNTQLRDTKQFLMSPNQVGLTKKEGKERYEQIQKILVAREKLQKAGPISVTPEAPPQLGVFHRMLNSLSNLGADPLANTQGMGANNQSVDPLSNTQGMSGS